MTTFYKFPDQYSFEALETDVAVDVIGLIQSGTTEVDGEQVPVYFDGWHVNTLEPVPEWEEYEIKVDSPMRIFG